MTLGINGRFYGARVTGVQRFATEVAARLMARGNVTLFVPRDVVVPADLAGCAQVVRGTLAGRLWEQVELPRRARATGCSVMLHLSNTAPGWGGPHVVTVYDVTPLTHPEWYTHSFVWWFRLALARAARRAALVLALSEWERAEICRVLGIEGERVRVVSQGVEPFDRPATPAVVDRVRRKWDIAGEYLLAVGAGRRKNLDFLTDVMNRWARRGQALPTLIVAGAEYPRVHGRWAASQSMNGHARVLGYVSDEELHGLYTGASAFCFPSFDEGFGRPPLEAMACGTPAVVADYGAAREVLADGASIVPLDADRWIAALQAVLWDAGARARAVASGRARAARYRWDPAVDQIAEVCGRVARHGGARS